MSHQGGGGEKGSCYRRCNGEGGLGRVGGGIVMGGKGYKELMGERGEGRFVWRKEGVYYVYGGGEGGMGVNPKKTIL